MKPNVTTFSALARELNCSRATLYRAADDGRLNTAEVGGTRMILLDEKKKQFEPKNVGYRKQRQQSSGE